MKKSYNETKIDFRRQWSSIMRKILEKMAIFLFSEMSSLSPFHSHENNLFITKRDLFMAWRSQTFYTMDRSKRIVIVVVFVITNDEFGLFCLNWLLSVLAQANESHIKCLISENELVSTRSFSFSSPSSSFSSSMANNPKSFFVR